MSHCVIPNDNSVGSAMGHNSSEDEEGIEDETHVQRVWSPSGIWWKDFLHFVGPGWFVSIAYVDPGNYQADIQAGGTSRYSLLFILWWTSILSMYVQILCVRLAYCSNMSLAEAQAKNSASDRMRYLSWFLAEFSTVITDVPEVIGIGIACNIFFGWPYYVGVVLSLMTTMIFLATVNCGIRVLETIIVIFVGIMSIALFIEMDFAQPDAKELMQGWAFGFTNLSSQDIFAITGVVGSVVMPHNLYLHSASCYQSRPIARPYVKDAVRWSSWEPVFPILVSFFINLAIVAIAAERVFGVDGADQVGLTDFCNYFQKLTGGCSLWAVALLAAGQSSAITTTYTGQYVMDGFLTISIPMQWRAIMTRLVAITPCVIVSIAFPNNMNKMVNVVNSSLSVLLPFAFTPLVKFNCSKAIMGEAFAARGYERVALHLFAVAVWLTNALALSMQGGGFFGDWRASISGKPVITTLVLILEITIQTFYAWWNWNCLRAPIIYSREVPGDEIHTTASSLELMVGDHDLI
jgi:natural resistance-associated macrophage protein 2